MGIEFCELQTISNFTFLKGASHPEELVKAASKLGYKAISIADENSFAGIVRGYFTAKDLGIKYVVATRLTIKSTLPGYAFEVLAYPQSRHSYGKLCALLSKGNLATEKGQCILSIDDLATLTKDTLFITSPPRTLVGASSNLAEKNNEFRAFCNKLHEVTERQRLFLALTRYYGNSEQSRTELIFKLAKYYDLRILATSDVLYHAPSRRALQDVLTCVRHKTTLTDAGFLLSHNAERYLKPLAEIKRLYRDSLDAIKQTVLFTEQCEFSLETLRYEYPNEVCPPGVSAAEYLRKLTFEGASKRYCDAIPERICKLLNEELALIRDLKYEHYFLTCYDIVNYARSIGVLCQGRGAAANSAVCFCLGITSVDPSKIELLFARFVSKARNEPPDIDIDFEHERREEVIQYIYSKYGRSRAGLVCNVITYRERSAVREVGKALGLSSETVGILASLIHRWDKCKIPAEDIVEVGLNPTDPTIQNCFTLTEELVGFPRHLSQHSGGFVISERLLSETVPILNSGMESRTIIEWNKDDIELLGMLKIDVLALGMLTCIRKALELYNARNTSFKPLELYQIPHDDMTVYDMICKADTVGVFQIESRAQMSMLPRLRPRCFYDLVIEIAIVRPGPIHGQMVHPYLKRRSGIEKVYFPDERIKDILGKTLGVPLFQEQAMRLAMAVANFTAEEADKLRRAMAAWRRNKEAIAGFQGRIMLGMLQNGYTKEFAESCIEQMKGFSEYGFPESHAASFAHLVYASSWLKRHYPAEFSAAILNSQPMGFYSPSQLVRDAQDHNVKILPIDIKYSLWDCTVDYTDITNPVGALRLGFRLIKGLEKTQCEFICTTKELISEFSTIKELYSAAHAFKFHLRKDTLEKIARADGFKSLDIDPRRALWEIKSLPSHPGPLDIMLHDEKSPSLPQMTLQQAMFLDYRTTGLSLKAHPMQLLRSRLTSLNVLTSNFLKTVRPKSTVRVAGLVTCRQRPGTAKGIVFLTLEDEVGSANLIIKPAKYEEYRRIITSSVAAIATGRLERTAEVIHVIVNSLEPLDDWLTELRTSGLQSNSYSY